MNFLDDISRDTLIICESDNKKKILNKIGLFEMARAIISMIKNK